MNYTLISRGIVPNLSIPVVDLNFTGGSATVSNLPPRDAAYFRVQVPTNTPGWNCGSPHHGRSHAGRVEQSVTNVGSGRLPVCSTANSCKKPEREHLPATSAGGSVQYHRRHLLPLAAVGEGVNPLVHPHRLAAALPSRASATCRSTTSAVGFLRTSLSPTTSKAVKARRINSRFRRTRPPSKCGSKTASVIPSWSSHQHYIA